VHRVHVVPSGLPVGLHYDAADGSVFAESEYGEAAGIAAKTRNSKPEIRMNARNPKPQCGAGFLFWASGLGLHSDFWFLVSGFGFICLDLAIIS
jgi:hypothetical protein